MLFANNANGIMIAGINVEGKMKDELQERTGLVTLEVCCASDGDGCCACFTCSAEPIPALMTGWDRYYATHEIDFDMSMN